MKSCFACWELRSLSLKGKIVVVNTLVLSLLQYMSSLIYTPQKVIEEVKALTVAFIWGRGRSKIAYSTLIQATADGGLKLADPETRVKVNLLSWVRRLLREPRSCPAVYLQHLTDAQDVRHMLHWKPRRSPLNSASPRFYDALLRNWVDFHSFPPQGEIEIRGEELWHNRYMGVALQDPILRKRWKEAGITTLQDICHTSDSRLLSHDEIRDKFHVHCTFLEALQIRMSVPIHWREALTRDYTGDTTPLYNIKISNGAALPLQSTSPKKIYAEIISARKGVIKVQRRWDSSVDIDDGTEWAEIYLRPFLTVRETRLQSFQYRLSHRLITCNRLLSRYKIKQEDTCSFCDGADTLEHFFYQCPISRKFWDSVFGWMKDATGQDLRGLTLKEIMLGVPKTFRYAKRTNSLLLISRYFIHRQRLFHKGDLCLIHWARELRKRLLTEKHICEAEGEPHKFDVWTTVLEYLG